MTHPNDFHLSEDAKQRCRGCSHPELLSFDTEDVKLAKQLISEGWLSTSNKYRLVARVNISSFEECVTLNKTPSSMGVALKRAYDQHKRTMCRCDHSELTEHRELTTAQFRAFKSLGGGMA